MKRCAITDGSAGWRADWLVARCKALGADGVDLLVIREHGLEAGELARFARRVVAAAAAAGGARVLLAGPPELALEAGAAGIHLSARAGELSVAQVRAGFPAAFVTRSCHTLDEVRSARMEGADAVLFGPVFGKWVEGRQVVRGVGLERLAEAVAAAGDVPVYALGGITRDNAGLCACAGVAAIRMFFDESVSCRLG